MPPRLAATALAAVLLATGCGIPEGDQDTPEGVHYAFVRARVAGELDRVWDLLHPDARALFNQWHASEQEAVKLIKLIYPEAERKLALGLLADGERAALPDGRALFQRVLGDGALPELGAMARLGARVRSVTVRGDAATLRTWAGDRIGVHKADDGRWYRLLSQEETERLRQVARTAEGNLQRVQRNIAALRGERP